MTAPLPIRMTVRVRRGYRVLRRVGVQTSAPRPHPLRRLWAALFPRLTPEQLWARERHWQALDAQRSAMQGWWR